MALNEDKKLPRVHLYYIIGILSALVIGIISVEWAEVPRLYEYINFALTMSSLILAALAIIYALHTSGSLFKTLDKIEESAASIIKSSEKIEKSNSQLSGKIESIPEDLAEVKESTRNSQKILEEHRLYSNENKKINITNKAMPDELVQQYLGSSSLNTLDAVMLFKISHDLKKPISIIKLAKAFEDSFSRGIIVSTHDTIRAFNLVNIDYVNEPNEGVYFNVLTIHPYIMKNLEKDFEKAVEVRYKTLGETDDELKKDSVKRKKYLESIVIEQSYLLK